MSQYPSPYNTPQFGQFGFDPAAGLLAPARRAAILMFVLGGLGVACGVCTGAFAAMGPIDQIIQRAKIQFPSNMDVPPEQLFRIIIGTIAVISLLQAIVMIILGVFVRRGGIGSIVTSIVLCVLILLMLVVQALGALFRGGIGQLQGLVFLIIALGLYGLLLTWLIQAARAAPAVRAMRTQSQLWQMQQQQQMYNQSGYPPPPPQQTPSPPPREP
jgi:hypothetical protein